jgi:hypothetical protein
MQHSPPLARPSAPPSPSPPVINTTGNALGCHCTATATPCAALVQNDCPGIGEPRSSPLGLPDRAFRRPPKTRPIPWPSPDFTGLHRMRTPARHWDPTISTSKPLGVESPRCGGNHSRPAGALVEDETSRKAAAAKAALAFRLPCNYSHPAPASAWTYFGTQSDWNNSRS